MMHFLKLIVKNKINKNKQNNKKTNNKKQIIQNKK